MVDKGSDCSLFSIVDIVLEYGGISSIDDQVRRERERERDR
jgi:hypothetical protein